MIVSEKLQATRPSKEQDRLFITALARGLDVLRCFSRAHPTLGTAELARMTGLPQPTVWRICHTLLQDGYLVKIGDKLRPGIPVLSLGVTAIARMPIAELARADMEAVAQRHQCAIVLSAPDGLSMTHVQFVQGSFVVFPELDIGARTPMAVSASGWAYIVALPDAQRQAVLAELEAAEQVGWPELAPELMLAQQQFRTSGYVINKRAMDGQVNKVGVPVLSLDGTPKLALAAGGISQVFDDAKLALLASDLKQLAAQIAPAL